MSTTPWLKPKGFPSSKDMKKLYLHPDDLQEHISKYKTFTTEHGRLVDINHFQILFLHKYGGSVATWTFMIEKSKKPNFPDKLICENVSGVSFIFPINK